LVLSHPRNGVEDELMALFRDDMLSVTPSTAGQYYTSERGYSTQDPDSDYEMNLFEFRSPGRVIATRLDTMGVDVDGAWAYLDEQLGGDADTPSTEFPDWRRELHEAMPAEHRAKVEHAEVLRKSLDARGWLDRLATAPDKPYWSPDPEPGSRLWLLKQLDYWDDLYVLRAVLLALPDAEVILDVTDLVRDGHLREAELEHMASDAAAAIRGTTAMHAPVVVLTEGRTDAEFLAAGLSILYPYLTDLIRFLDYERRPEGGVGALVRMVRAFASAGIVNRIVAVFDNDTAAADGLKVLSSDKLPDQIQVVRYPRLELAKNYPTLGPPTTDSPEGSLALADVNGLAGSIELYLGKDVLTGEDGTLYPVQWKSFIPGMSRYQGEVVNKEKIHEAFRAKYATAQKNRDHIEGQDWNGVRLIIDAIRSAALSAFGDSKPPPRLIPKF
jgi:hypothetical protein